MQPLKHSMYSMCVSSAQLSVRQAGTYTLFITQTQMHSLEHMSTHMHPRTCLHSHMQHVHTHKHVQKHTPALPSACTTLQGFRSTLTMANFYVPSIFSNSLPPFSAPFPSPPLLVLLQYGLSTSLLSVRHWYQAKNVPGVDSRHAGTGASTSASEPASWGIHSSGQVNTAALWNATLSYSQCVCLWERETVQMNKWCIKTTHN